MVLPKATVNKFTSDVAASLSMRLTVESRELIAECCTEFVQLLSTEANDICEEDKRKTITPEHVLRAIEQLGLNKYREKVEEAYERVKELDKQRGKGAQKKKMAVAGLSREELLKQQQELFAQARSDPMAVNKSAKDEPE